MPVSRCKWRVSLTSPAANASGYLKRSRPKSYVRDWRRQNRLPIFRYLSIGQQSVFSAGRVQTPLAMAVLARDTAIKQFQSTPYAVYVAHVADAQGNTITAQLLNPADDNSCMFPIDAAIAPEQFTGAKITSAEKNTQRKTQRPPQLYNITGLQKKRQNGLTIRRQKRLKLHNRSMKNTNACHIPERPAA